ncbi:hypothetical protein AB0F77_31320 [Streptomyces sp. NPDC026672]|uniref:glycosyltransferase family 39 protein n=1 Tax=unclassified Streptomyces TaxID=2593676 RepID=UPI0033D2F5AA
MASQAVLLLALSLVVRAPSFRRPFWSPDEGYLATEALMLRHGGRMYQDVVDRKPPLLPWLYEACFAAAGPRGLLLVRLLAVAALALTAVFTARLAARTLGTWAALPAGVLTVAASAALPAPDAMAATFEIFMLPATAAAMHFGVRGHWLAAGLAVSVATLTKQVGLAPLLPLALHAVTGRHRLRDIAALLAGAAAMPAGCALALGARRFVFWMFLSSGSYATSPPGIRPVAVHALGNLASLFTAFAPVVAVVMTAAWHRRRPLFPSPRAGAGRGRKTAAVGTDRMLGLWLFASACGVTVGFHFYGHYFLQLAPPLVLLGLRAVDLACRASVVGRPHAAAVAAGCALAVAMGWSTTAVRAEPPLMDKTLAVAAAVDAYSAPGERVFLWGMHPEVYWLAGRQPASRYLTAGLLTNFSGGGNVHRVGAAYAVPGAWQVLRHELAAHPPCLLVDDSAGTPYPLADYPQLRGLLAHGFREKAVVHGARIYRRTGC